MPQSLHEPRARTFEVLAVLAGLLAAAPATAADPAHAEHAKPTPAARAAAPASAATKAHAEPSKDAHGATKDAHAATGKAEASPVQDPLDQLRERLAQKLGATKAPGARSERSVQVASRATGEFQVSAAAHGPARAASRAKPAGPDKPHAAAPGDAHAPAGHGHAPHWSYEGETGPQAWGQLRPDFSACSTGSRQSPIDIRDGFAVELEPLRFDYRATGFRVIDNGHTVQVDVGPGNSFEVMGRRFELVQFHFHRPSEERINGRAFDMVAHLVHKDAQGRLAVIAVLLDRGSLQPVIQTVWNNLPLEKGEPLAARVPLDLNQLLPEDRRYYTYMGSLTTPPCSEGVLWVVLQKPVTVSVEQIEIFSRLYPMNARPVQASAGRMIKQSN